MSPTNMAPVGEPKGDGDVAPAPAGGSEPGKTYSKALEGNVEKAANGPRVAFRPARTKLATLAKERESMKESLTKGLADKLQAKRDNPTKKFETTKERDEARWKAWSECIQAMGKDRRYAPQDQRRADERGA
jgi:hypothetical protein